MSTQVPILQVIADKLVVSAVVALVGGIFLWPFRKIKKEWGEATNKLTALQEELQVQRTNHLTHIEHNTQETVTVLKDVAKTLQDIHLDQKESFGYLRGLKK